MSGDTELKALIELRSSNHFRNTFDFLSKFSAYLTKPRKKISKLSCEQWHTYAYYMLSFSTSYIYLFPKTLKAQ